MTEPDLPPKKPSPNEKYWELIRIPAARTYFLIAASGLGVASAAAFMFSSPLGAAALAVAGVCGLVLRLTSMPVIYVLLLAWFSVAPAGIPDLDGTFSNIPGSHMRLADLTVVGGSLVYLLAQYRLYSVVHGGMPFEARKAYLKSTAKPTVRPGDPLPDAEVGRFFVRVAVYLLAGQAAWLLLTHVRVDLAAFPPFAWVPPAEHARQRVERAMLLSEPASRYALAVGAAVAGLGLARFALWYRHLSRMLPEEADLVILDDGWRENRRELGRQEAWRGDAQTRKPTLARPKMGCGGAAVVVLGVGGVLFLGMLLMCCGGGLR